MNNETALNPLTQVAKLKHRLDSRINRITANALIKNIGWMTSAQLLNRILRLAVTVFVARILMPQDYGLLAIIFTAHELVVMLIQRSTQTRIINCRGDELESICHRSARLNWQISSLAFVLQLLLAVAFVKIYANQELLYPLFYLGLSHLLLPFAMVQAALNIRNNRFKLVASINVAQTFIDSLLTIILLFLDFGLWSIVIPKLLVVPLWVVAHRSQNQWRFQSGKLVAQQSATLQASFLVVLVDGMLVLRNNLDYLLVGHFLGLQALGIYFFAFNAGLGISNGIIQAVGPTLLPHFCGAAGELSRLKKDFIASLRTTLLIVGGVVILQTSLAYYYVPIVFGEKWETLGAIPVLIILCLSAIPRMANEFCSQLLRAKSLLYWDFVGNSLITLSLLIVILFALPYGIVGVAVAVLSSLLISVPLFMLWTLKKLFSDSSISTQSAEFCGEKTHRQ